MTKKQREEIEALIAQILGVDEWWGEGLSEEQCARCCERCPFAEQCGEEELYWGCAVWEEAMGEDL